MATRIYMDGGPRVRVGETLDEVVNLLDDAERHDGWAVFEDPGDGRTKLVRVARVLWVEEEPEQDAPREEKGEGIVMGRCAGE